MSASTFAARLGCLLLLTFVQARWILDWHDEFNGRVLDESSWKYQLNASWNHELQSYTRNRNVRLKSGHLIIEARPEKDDNYDFTSGRLLSTRAWNEGRFEVRARLPRGRQLWPAIWMLPREKKYGLWWKNGEIDLMEMQGEKANTISSTLHFGGTSSTSGNRRFNVDFSRRFHRFGLVWSRRKMRWFIDGRLFHSVNIHRNLWGKPNEPNEYTAKGQPFIDQKFYFILNVAVGGMFFGDVPKVTPEEAKSWPKPTMEVDYVRVWKWKK